MAESSISEAGDQEIDLEIGGQKVRARGYRLIDLVWLPLVLGMAYVSMMAYQQEARAQVEKSTIAKVLKDSNETTAAIAKESNANIINALKENNELTVRALDRLNNTIERLTIEQKKTTRAQKETACLLDPAVKNRMDGRELCKRMVRESEG